MVSCGQEVSKGDIHHRRLAQESGRLECRYVDLCGGGPGRCWRRNAISHFVSSARLFVSLARSRAGQNARGLVQEHIAVVTWRVWASFSLAVRSHHRNQKSELWWGLRFPVTVWPDVECVSVTTKTSHGITISPTHRTSLPFLLEGRGRPERTAGQQPQSE